MGLWGKRDYNSKRGPQSKEVRHKEGDLEGKGLLTGWGAGLAGSGVDRRYQGM